MVYRFEADERPGPAVRRAFREQNARILVLLRSWEDDPAECIHRARQGCKRARALAQLLKPRAPYVARVENDFFRSVQQGVAYARDPEALVEALDFIEIGIAPPRVAESVALLRESLAARARRELDEGRRALRARVADACAALMAADRRLCNLPLEALRRRDLKRGAERTWLRCARIYNGLHRESPAADFHVWRRHVKYAYHQAQLLSAWQPRLAAALMPHLHELAVQLGHGQDLVLLEALFHQQPDPLGIDTHVQRLRHMIAASMLELRCQSLALGRELFGPGDPGQSALPLTQGQQSSKKSVTDTAKDAGSSVRRPHSDRVPHPDRRWQSG